MAHSEDKKALELLKMNRGKQFHFYVCEPDASPPKLLLDTSAINSDTLKKVFGQTAKKNPAIGKLMWDDDNKLKVTPKGSQTNLEKNLTKVTTAAKVKPAEIVIGEEEGGGQTTQPKGDPGAPAAAAKLQVAVKELIKAVDQELKDKPKEAAEILKHGDEELKKLDEAFKSQYPDSTQYPKDDVDDAREHLAKLHSVVDKKSVEKSETTGKVKHTDVLHAATALGEWIDSHIKVVAAITIDKLEKARISAAKGIEQLSKVRIELGDHVSKFAKLEGHQQYLEGEWKLKDKISQLTTSIQSHIEPLQESSHGNVRALEEKEDRLIRGAIDEIKKQPKAMKFQKDKFDKRMGLLSGMGESGAWDSMIGGGSNPFDIISQGDVAVVGKGPDDKDIKLGYLPFQDSLYPGEWNSRKTLIEAFYKKKLKENPGSISPELKKAVEDMQKITTSKASDEEKKTAVNDAFGLMGMKGVGGGANEAREMIKGDLFLGKGNEALSRGRKLRTPTDGVMGFSDKAIQKLLEDKNNSANTEKAEKIGRIVGEMKELQKQLAEARLELNRTKSRIAEVKDKLEDCKDKQSKLNPGDTEGLQKLKELETNLLDEQLKLPIKEKQINALIISLVEQLDGKRGPDGKLLTEKDGTVIDSGKSGAALELMKGLNIGLKDDGREEVGGIGADDTSGDRDVYQSESEEIAFGKNINVRDDESGSANIFRELGIPFTGGASGSTADAVGGIVDDMLTPDEDRKMEEAMKKKAAARKKEPDLTKKQAQLRDKQSPSSEDLKQLQEVEEALNQVRLDLADAELKLKEVELKDDDPRLAKSEAEICMYIIGMHSAGHHSLVEMIYAAKQYPQKFFRTLHDPITDLIDWNKKCGEFREQHPIEEYQNKQGEQLDKPTLFAKREEALRKAWPESMVITHGDCVTKFMTYAKTKIANVNK